MPIIDSSDHLIIFIKLSFQRLPEYLSLTMSIIDSITNAYKSRSWDFVALNSLSLDYRLAFNFSISSSLSFTSNSKNSSISLDYS